MGLLQQIKQDQLECRKAGKKYTAILLGTLYSEAAAVGKDNGNRESTDSEVVTVVKKFIKNIDESIGVNGDNEDELLVQEKAIYEKYLPSQLTVEELTEILSQFIAEGKDNGQENKKLFGQVMSRLKDEYEGHYDGKKASEIIKALLSS